MDERNFATVLRVMAGHIDLLEYRLEKAQKEIDELRTENFRLLEKLANLQKGEGEHNV